MTTQPHFPAPFPSAVPTLCQDAPNSEAVQAALDARTIDTATKRVVHVSLGTHVGGMEKLLIEFARFADRARFELTFISLQSRGKLADEIEGLGWPVIAMDKSVGLRPDLVFKLAWRMRQLRADVVHTHNTAAFVYGVPAATLARVPRIIHTRHGQRFDATARQTWLFRSLAKCVDRVVSVSEDGRRLTVDEGIPTTRACTIRNGVDLDRFPYAGPNSQGNAVLVARLSPEKDVATLVRAVAIANAHPSTAGKPLALDIVGDGSERSRLESLSRELHQRDAIRFHGLRSDIPNVLAGASMFVLPSLTEGISLTLLEAMARGLPVIATDVGGNPEVVCQEETGLLVPAANPDALAEAMIRLHRNPGLAGRYGRQGRKRIEEHFRIQKMIDAYQQLYTVEVSS